MNDWSIIIMSVVILLALLIALKYTAENQVLRMKNHDLKKIHDVSGINVRKLEMALDECLKIKHADENIMYYTRCINDPRKNVCKVVDSNNQDYCSARFMDCNKFKGIVESDPVAIQRMKFLNSLPQLP